MPDKPLEVVASPASVPSQWPDASNDTLRPNQVDALPDAAVAAFRPRRPWRALLAAGAVACAGLIGLAVHSTASAPAAIAELPRPQLTATASQAPAALVPAMLTAAPSSQAAAPAAASSSQSSIDSSEAPLSNAADTTRVTVNVSPSDASVFEQGRRLGKGVVTVDVASGSKTTLVVRLDGYGTRTVVLDGKNTTVNIALNPLPASRPMKPEVAASPDPPSDFQGASDNPY